MAESRVPNPSERVPKINRRNLLTTTAGVAASAILPDVAHSDISAFDPIRSLPAASGVPLRVCASTAHGVSEIERRNEIRREANLPLLPIAKELRRMKEEDDKQKFSKAFGPFAAKHSEAVWNEVLKSSREAFRDAHWRPNWIAGMGYQSEVSRILRERFRVEQAKQD